MLRQLVRAFGWLVIVLAVAAVALAVLVPRLGGATPYTVLTGSMRPSLPPGTLVVVRPTAAEDLGIGSVVTYQLTSGDPAVVTHRIVAQAIDADGEPVFRTQGDANDVPDEKWVRPVQIKGELWYAVPYLGYASDLLTGHQRQTGIYLVAAGFFGYALLMFAEAARDRRRAARTAGSEPTHV